MKAILILVVGLFAVGAIVISASNIGAYPTYHGNGNCFTCHPGFDNRGPLHDLHVGSSQMTGTCLLCHTSIGDDPSTGSSGADPENSCSGCHMLEGLVMHHENAGAPADPSGLKCVTCHGTFDPPGEDTLPPYYSRADVNVKDPCDGATAGPGEDYSGDGEGLDNDGDLLYDSNDPDCEVVQVEVMTWGQAKAMYR
jgi:hypothetical protein